MTTLLSFPSPARLGPLLLTMTLAAAACTGGEEPDLDPDPSPDAEPDADGGEMDPEPDAGPAGPGCGDGTLQANEACEGFELRQATCADEGFTTGQLACADDCTLDTTGCSACGDGQLTGDEVCEPGDLMGATCASLMGPGFIGSLTCAPDCSEVITSGCREELPASPFEACDPDAAQPCADGVLSCVSTTSGDFCLEPCDLNTADACGDDARFCLDLDGTGVCLDRPALGELCTEAATCVDTEASCLPAFQTGDGPVSICAETCAAHLIGTGEGCAAGQSCVPVPSGQLELQLPQVVCTTTGDCDEEGGYQCLPTSADGSTPDRCLRPVTVCAEPIPFHAFDGMSTAASFCDLTSPTQGLAMCGIGSNVEGAPGPMASAVCYPLLPLQDDLGVCVGFCDSAVLDTAIDGFCGDGFLCAAPSQPEFFVAENQGAAVACDLDAPACTQSHPVCLDLGRGPECARPARLCVPQ